MKKNTILTTLSFFLVVMSSNLALAESEGIDLDSTLTELGGDLEKGMSELGKAMIEMGPLLKDAMGEMGKSLGGVNNEMKQLTGDMFKDLDTNLVSNARKISFPADEIKFIEFQGRLQDITVTTNDESDQIIVEFSAFGQQDKYEELQNLLNSIFYQRENTDIVITDSISWYLCASSRGTSLSGNSFTAVKGACFGKIIVKIPFNRQIAVSYEGHVLNGMTGRPMSVDQLVQQLDTSFSSKHMRIIDDFVQSHSEGELVLHSRDLHRVLEELFSNKALTAFKKLAPYVPKSERPDLFEVIDDVFMDRDEKEASRFLLTL